MNNKQAKAILKELLNDTDSVLSETELYCVFGLINSRPNVTGLDGEFTADHLEAISMWMRDPKGVVLGKATHRYLQQFKDY